MLDEPGDAERLAACGQVFAARIVGALPGWIERIVGERGGNRGVADVGALATGVVAAVKVSLAQFFETDLDEQRTTPLAVVRGAIRPVTAHLASCGVAPMPRDPFDERANPDDIYALGPVSWVDLGDDVQVAGLEWGAAKAFVHRRRHT